MKSTISKVELEIRHEFKKVFSSLLNNNRSYYGRFITFANSWIPVLFNVFQSSAEHGHCLFFISKKYASPVFEQRQARVIRRVERKNITLLEGNTENDLHRIFSAAGLLGDNSYVFCLLPHSDNLCKHLTGLSIIPDNVILMIDLDYLPHKGEDASYNKIISRYKKLKNSGWNFVPLKDYNLEILINTIYTIRTNDMRQPAVIALKTNWMQMLIDL